MTVYLPFVLTPLIVAFEASPFGSRFDGRSNDTRAELRLRHCFLGIESVEPSRGAHCIVMGITDIRLSGSYPVPITQFMAVR